jgi:glyoxylate reductase
VEVNPEESPPSKELFIQKVHDTDGVLCLLTDRIDVALIDSARKLKVISSLSVGYDHIDVSSATKKGIYVTFTPGVLTEATADLTWTLLMAVARRLVEADNYVREGKWKVQWSPTLFLGAEVHGKTLGIIGLGRIGQAVARRAKGFNMRLLYFDAIRAKAEMEETLGIELVPLSRLLRQADFVTIHAPLTEETRHLIGEEELRQMKRTAYLLNTARGPLLDQTALVRALREGWIAGAALDVFEKEPMEPNDPLISLKNVILAPHIASGTREARSKMAEVAAKNLISVLRGELPQFLVNEEVLKVRPLSKVRMIG